MSGEARRLADSLFREGFEAQMTGELERALRLYRESIEACPTAEAYTYLGWTFSFMGRLDDAIALCREATLLDPEYGNPYNDIGAYLIEKGELDEAIEWLQKAIQAKRYDSYCFPWMNLGRIWERKGRWQEAIRCYRQALCCNGEYAPAARALARIRSMMN
ncbi:MAG: tetratricopeptide repeat protein [Chloroflexi bacterium]|nr:tetratricopeptide repeat protein [Chloroflexota bacterium]